MKKKKIIIGVICALIVIILGIIVYANNMLNKINYTNWEDSQKISDEDLDVDTEEVDENLTKLNPEDVDMNNVDPLDSIPDVSNILLIGGRKCLWR